MVEKKIFILILTMKSLIQKELISFKFALKGIYNFFITEKHARFHLIAAFLVILAGVAFHISLGEWCVILIAIGMVLVAEIFNTAIEKLADAIWPEKNSKAAFVKDVAAGGVLIASIVAVILGIIVFFPYFF